MRAGRRDRARRFCVATDTLSRPPPVLCAQSNARRGLWLRQQDSLSLRALQNDGAFINAYMGIIALEKASSISPPAQQYPPLRVHSTRQRTQTHDSAGTQLRRLNRRASTGLVAPSRLPQLHEPARAETSAVVRRFRATAHRAAKPRLCVALTRQWSTRRERSKSQAQPATAIAAGPAPQAGGAGRAGPLRRRARRAGSPPRHRRHTGQALQQPASHWVVSEQDTRFW